MNDQRLGYDCDDLWDDIDSKSDAPIPPTPICAVLRVVFLGEVEIKSGEGIIVADANATEVLRKSLFFISFKV